MNTPSAERRLLPLTTWLIIALAVMIIPPLAIFGWWQATEMEERANKEFRLEAERHFKSIEESIDELVSLKIEILEIIASTIKEVRDWDTFDLQNLVDAQIRASRSFRSLYLGDQEGLSLIFAPSVMEGGAKSKVGVSYADRDYFQNLLKTQRSSLGSVKIGRQVKEPNLHIAAPIFGSSPESAQNLRGFVVAGISPNLIGEVLKRELSHRESYRGIMIDEYDRVVYDSQSKLSILDRLKEDDTLLLCQGHTALDEGDQSRKGYCKSLKISGLPWRVWIIIPSEVVNETASVAAWAVNRNIAFVCFVIFILKALFSIRLKKITQSISDTAAQLRDQEMNLLLPDIHWHTPKEVALFTHIASQTIDYFHESREHALERERTLNLFGQHVDPEIAKKLLEQTVHAEKRDVTVLFTDLRGFTALSERVDPDTLLELLNAHFNTIVPVIHKYGGTLNKFIGDAVMATFGAPIERPDHALRACEASLEMLIQMEKLNQELRAQGLPELRMGVGISTGPVILGLLGTEERREYAVIGDTVNVAARLEGLNSKLSTKILLSKMTHEALEGKLPASLVDHIPVKGKSQPVEVYTISQP